jgi:excisionase family DNA binding protein
MIDVVKIQGSTETKRLLNLREVAALLNVSIHTLRQWVHQRKVPYLKLGKAVRIAPEDLEKFLEENRKEVVTF